MQQRNYLVRTEGGAASGAADAAPRQFVFVLEQSSAMAAQQMLDPRLHSTDIHPQRPPYFAPKSEAVSDAATHATSSLDPNWKDEQQKPGLQQAAKRTSKGEPVAVAAGSGSVGSPQSNPQSYYLPTTSRSHRGSIDSADHADYDVSDDGGDDLHESPETLEDGFNGNQSPEKPSDVKRPRACDSCRGLKVRCIIDPTSGEPCKRCEKAHRQCIVTPPTRKRVKKADSRVAELEKKINVLTATLRAQNAGDAYADGEEPLYLANQRLLGERIHTRIDTYNDTDSSPPLSVGSRKKRRIDSDTNSRAPSPTPADDATMRREILGNANGAVLVTSNIYNERKPIVFDHSDIDGKIDALIDRETAVILFDRYVRDFASQFPAVVFPSGTTADQVRTQKPVLFMAIVAHTGYGFGLERDVQRRLVADLRDILADSMWRNGEKSLELIQALQVATLWYRPPKNFEQHMFYQTVHAAAVMSLDIGMGRRQYTRRRPGAPSGGSLPGFGQGIVLPNVGSAEVRRAWLTNYMLCISITMVIRRPILLRWNPYMQECVDYLLTAPDAYPSDVLFCQHVKLARVAEEIATSFNFDDMCSTASMADRRVVFGMKRFERDLADLAKKNLTNPALLHSEHVINLYIHEIALHHTQPETDSRTSTNGEAPNSLLQRVIGADHVDAVNQLAKSCKAILDTYLAYEFESLFMLPIIFSVRTVYACVVLLKLYVAATTPGEMINIIRKEDLHIQSYLAKMAERLQKIMNRDPQIPHAKFLFVVQRLNERYHSLMRQGEQRQRMKAEAGEGMDAAGVAGVKPVSNTSAPYAVMASQQMQPPAMQPGIKMDEQPQQNLRMLGELAGGDGTMNMAQMPAQLVEGSNGQQQQPQPQQQMMQMPPQQPQPQQNQLQHQDQQHHVPGQDQMSTAHVVQQWYTPNGIPDLSGVAAGIPVTGMGGIGTIEPLQYGQFNGQFSGFDNFDFSLGGMGFDGDLYSGGAAMSDQMWEFSDPALIGQYQMQSWM